LKIIKTGRKQIPIAASDIQTAFSQYYEKKKMVFCVSLCVPFS